MMTHDEWNVHHVTDEWSNTEKMHLMPSKKTFFYFFYFSSFLSGWICCCIVNWYIFLLETRQIALKWINAKESKREHENKQCKVVAKKK